MAVQFSGFFDSTAEVDNNYSQAQLAVAFRALGGTGAGSLDDGLRVQAEGSTMRTLVNPGLAMIQGYAYELKDDGGEQMAVTHAASASSDRMDRIVLRLELADGGHIRLNLLSGTPGANPQPPTLTRTDTVYEISLAKVRIRAGATEIAAADVIDERRDEAACGALVPAGLRLDALWERMAKPNATAAAPGLMPETDKAYLDKLQPVVTISSDAVDIGGKYLDNAKFR